MATDYSTSGGTGEVVKFRGPVGGFAAVVGGAALIAGILSAAIFEQHAVRRFFFAYLVSFMYFLSMALGGLFFTLLQHVTKAGWSVSVRRIAEWLAASFPILAVLAIPIVLPVLMHRGDVYYWADSKGQPPAELTQAVPSLTTSRADALGTINARGAGLATTERTGTQPQGEAAGSAPAVNQPTNSEPRPTAAGPEEANGKTLEKAEAPEEMTGFKKIYLSPTFWTLRIVAYFVVWSWMGIWYWQKSLEQDASGDIKITSEMQSRSPVAIVLYAITVTGAAFDLLMALDPNWSSTIFGVYYFSGCVIGILGTLIVTVRLLQRAGYLKTSVTIEHYHDLGKLLFAFTFFWGYIAFSQYMLQWYANIPEETLWWRHHGASQSLDASTQWSWVLIILLVCRLLIPFAALVSRHVKRNPSVLAFWAAWLLLFHWVDLYWVVMPQLDYKLHFGLVDILMFVGIGGIFVSSVLKRASAGALRPTQDPRLPAAIAFQNI